jgi:hypothetical protein
MFIVTVASRLTDLHPNRLLKFFDDLSDFHNTQRVLRT